MKYISLLLSLLLVFFLTACSKKDGQREQTAPGTAEDVNISDLNQSSLQAEEVVRSFILTDVDGRDLNITIDGDTMIFPDIEQPLLLLNFFATWCPPCRGELLSLSHLQKKHAKDLFVVGVLFNDEQNSTQLRHLMEKYDANYFISHASDNDDLAAEVTKRLELPENFSIPLSVLYKNGKLYRYYEGAMPIEMIDNELKQAIKQL
ncbi:MAG: TlpA disulfide reductase family protein [Campylobacterota bacterium]|nr:TlpA disulfide reductase family protein [Campylobacterota bacterium]